MLLQKTKLHLKARPIKHKITAQDMVLIAFLKS